MITVPALPHTASSHGDVILYAVKSPTDIVRYDPNLASGYKFISPIMRYFAADSEVVGLVYGLTISNADTVAKLDSRSMSTLLLTFDRKGALQSSAVLDSTLHIEQIAAYESGDLLLVAWDDLRKKTVLSVTDKTGSQIREFHPQENDPGDAESELPLISLKIHSYGKNLLLISDDPSRPILEVSESGVVNTHTLHVPKGYVRGLPISISRRSWKFFMIPDATGDKPASLPDQQSKPPVRGADSLLTAPGVMLEFNPEDGSVLRQIELPSSGFQPACENDGDYIFLSAHAGDGKLQLVKASVAE